MPVMPKCPTCSKRCRTLQGVRIHHTRVHDDVLPNRTCEGCNTEFYDPKAQLVFCEDCNPNAGENNGNWKDAMETTICNRCNTTFDYYPSEKPGIYCADCVADGAVPERPDLRVDRLNVNCRYCNKSMKVLPSRVRGNTYGVFCEQECYAEWLSATIVGERHHQWEGGTFPYGEGWWSLRRRALR